MEAWVTALRRALFTLRRAQGTAGPSRAELKAVDDRAQPLLEGRVEGASDVGTEDCLEWDGSGGRKCLCCTIL